MFQFGVQVVRKAFDERSRMPFCPPLTRGLVCRFNPSVYAIPQHSRDVTPGQVQCKCTFLRSRRTRQYTQSTSAFRRSLRRFPPLPYCTVERLQSFCQNKEGEGVSECLDSPVDLKQLASEKEEAKAVMVQFLKRLGLSTAFSTRIINKAGCFVSHLVSMLHSRYRTRYLTGRELTTIEIQATLLPYLEALAAEHGDSLVDVLVHFPNSPPSKANSSEKSASAMQKLWATKDVHGLMIDGNFRPSVLYALSLGLSLDQMQVLAHRFPKIVCYSPEKKMKPTVDFFLALGVTKTGILKIFLKRPQVFGCSLEENLKPTMVYLESIGVEKSQWSRILVHFPALLTYDKIKLQEVVLFFHDVGVASVDVGRIITRFPQVVSYSIQHKLNPTVKFLENIGVKDISTFLKISPQVLGYSIEGNIKPTVRFLLELGYSKKDIIVIINRFPQILGLAINSNIQPKWEFFADKGLPKSQIVAFPQYFGYSLEARIKPRFEAVLENGHCWTLSRILSSSEKDFQRLLKRERNIGASPLIRSSAHHNDADT